MATLNELIADRLAHAALAAGEDTLEALTEALEDDDEFQRNVGAAIAKQVQAYPASLNTEDDDKEFESVFEFFEQFLAPMYPVSQVRLDDRNWSDQWFKHDSVVLRLTALWHRYEQLRKAEPTTALETFLRVHADYHMDRLMADGGILADNKRGPEPTVPLTSNYDNENE